MASIHKLVAMTIILLISLSLSTVVTSASNNTNGSTGMSTLAARLKIEEGESTNCWDSLFELQACTGEVIMFFINGEAYLGPSCCKAIRVVGHDCWPNMLSSLGFTSEEGHILQDYCDNNSTQQQQNAPPTPPTPNV